MKRTYLFIIVCAVSTVVAWAQECTPTNTQTATISFTPLNGRASNKVFTIAYNSTVYFSKGNLQYDANGTHTTSDGKNTTGTYSFCDNQWDEGGKFAFECQKQTKQTTIIAGTVYDWGYEHAISNAGNQPEQWRTLTLAEWVYLLQNRPSASSKCAYYTVHGVKGLVLLPDDWTLPDGCSFTAGFTGNKSYTDVQWGKMEEAGAVFLPCSTAGTGYYWTATRDMTSGLQVSSNSSYRIMIYSTGANSGTGSNTQLHSVRLVYLTK